jgi:hypothetical protein
VLFGRVKARIGLLDKRLTGVACAYRGNIRPRCSPVERFINSFAITARRMCSATVTAARNTVFGNNDCKFLAAVACRGVLALDALCLTDVATRRKTWSSVRWPKLSFEGLEMFDWPSCAVAPAKLSV